MIRNFVGRSILILLLGWAHPGAAQVCHDTDGDDAQAGYTCASTADCNDRSWWQRPGAADVCDGTDNDCDGVLDAPCDRFCDSPTLYGPYVELRAEDSAPALLSCVELTDRGFLAVTQRLQTNGSDTLMYARSYDRLGHPWAGSSAIGEPSMPNPYERRCVLAPAGDRALAVYTDEHDRFDSSTFRLLARVIDAEGKPLGAAPLDLSTTWPAGATSTAPSIYQGAVWDGDRFAVLWVPSDDSVPGAIARSLLMSVISEDGTLAPEGTKTLLTDIDGNQAVIWYVRVVWTGTHYVVVVKHEPSAAGANNLRVLRINRDGVVESNQSVPMNVSSIDIAVGPDRIAIFSEVRDIVSLRQRAAFVDLDGNYMSGIGIVPLGTLAQTNVQAGDDRVTWTGEMFVGVLSTRQWNGTGYTYRWWLWRFLPGGTNLDPGGRMIAQSVNDHDAIVDVHWAGKDLWIFANRQTRRFTMSRVVCSCGDADGDLFNACSALDCDDGDPLTHPGALEACRGLRDEDCDGLVDCDDPDCPAGAPPADVGDLHWAGTSIAWTAVPGAERYDLARGLLSDLLRRGDLLQSDCAGRELNSASWADDGRDPPVGDVLWYLVRSEGTPCSLGTWGTASGTRQVSACR